MHYLIPQLSLLKVRSLVFPFSRGLKCSSDSYSVIIFVFGFQILWRGEEQIMADVSTPEDWAKNAGIKVADAI